MKNKLPLNLDTCHSILAVKGFNSIAESIQLEEQKLAQIVVNAKDFFSKCQKLNFIFSITYVRKAIQYADMPKYNKADFHVPVMVFVYWDVENKRREIYDWETISNELDQSNASLDERLLHMRVFFAFKNFQYQARMIAENLKILYKQNKELTRILGCEHMTLHKLPNFMK